MQKAFVKIQHFLPRVRFVICEFLQFCMYKRGVRAPHFNQGRVWCFTARVLTALNCAMVDHGMIIGGPKMSGNFVRERQRIVTIYVNNTLPLAHEISRHFWAAYGMIIDRGMKCHFLHSK